MEILIAGDYCPQNRVLSNCDSGEDLVVFEGLSDSIKHADYSVVNLECPVITWGAKAIAKQGPSLFCTERGVEALSIVGFNCVTLANNHFRDFGDSGCLGTINALTAKGIEYVGGGKSIQEASKVLYKRLEDRTISIINCCEREFSIATNNRAGANPLSPITQYHQIIEAKLKADFVIVIVHGGIEHFQYPTQRMVETYRFFIEAGADAVINHHQHCPCGYEVYKGKPIYYGLGNFCFDWEGRKNSIWNLGYMVKLHLEDNHQIMSEIVPYSQCDEEPIVKLLKGEKLEQFNILMDTLCSVIKDISLLDQKLSEFNRINDFLYRKMLEPYSGRFASLLYRKGMLPTTINKERILTLMDFVVCESHYERVKEFLERQYNHMFNE